MPANFNSGILVIDGAITVNEHKVPENHYLQLKNEDGEIHIKASKNSILLVYKWRTTERTFCRLRAICDEYGRRNSTSH
ncbi:MAG: hypothetical protein EXR21_09525 [Flavobacteriaceae bacterium]|nr:hypothetical protein [Flavobacteriaceae bacterium]